MDLTALKNLFFRHLLAFLFQELSNDVSSDSNASTTPSSDSTTSNTTPQNSSGTPTTSAPVPASFR